MKSFLVTIDDYDIISIKDAIEESKIDNATEMLKQLYNYSRMPDLKSSLSARRASDKLNLITADMTAEEEEGIKDAVIANYYFEENEFVKNNREFLFRLAVEDTLEGAEDEEESDEFLTDYDD